MAAEINHTTSHDQNRTSHDLNRTSHNLNQTIHFLDRTTSTMDEARSLALDHSSGAVMADIQTEGRGRIPGRKWETQPGQALLTTIWLPRNLLRNAIQLDTGKTEQDPPVSLLAGLAVARACRAWADAQGCAYRNGLAIKWPNDLICGSRKLAGLLCEATESHIYIGIGLNCAQDSFTEGYRTSPTSIFMETGVVPDRPLLLTMIMEEVWSLVGACSGWLEDINGQLAWRGKMVTFKPGMSEGKAIRGKLYGLASDGGLLLDTTQSLECFYSGELSPVIDEDSEA